MGLTCKGFLANISPREPLGKDKYTAFDGLIVSFFFIVQVFNNLSENLYCFIISKQKRRTYKM